LRAGKASPHHLARLAGVMAGPTLVLRYTDEVSYEDYIISNMFTGLKFDIQRYCFSCFFKSKIPGPDLNDTWQVQKIEFTGIPAMCIYYTSSRARAGRNQKSKIE
jgi:hypothetical protein